MTRREPGQTRRLLSLLSISLLLSWSSDIWPDTAVKSFWNVDKNDSRESSKLTLVCVRNEQRDIAGTLVGSPGLVHVVLWTLSPVCYLTMMWIVIGRYSANAYRGPGYPVWNDQRSWHLVNDIRLMWEKSSLKASTVAFTVYRHEGSKKGTASMSAY